MMERDRGCLLVFLTAALLQSCSAIPGLIDLGQKLSDNAKYDLVQGNFRIEAEIIKMINPRATTWNYFPCDIIPGSCNNKISVAIDYATPNNDFGKDSVPYDRYVSVFEGNGATVDINKIVSKDVCGHGTRKVNVRVLAKDKDFIRDDTIDHFNCLILTTDKPKDSDKDADFSEEKTCVGHNGSHKIIWKYRWFFISADDCKEVAGSSGIIRQLVPFLGK